MLVKSKAKTVAFFNGQRIEKGGKFTISEKTDRDGNIITVEQQFSKKWMEVVEVKVSIKTEKPIKQKKSSSKKAASVKSDV